MQATLSHMTTMLKAVFTTNLINHLCGNLIHSILSKMYKSSACTKATRPRFLLLDQAG